MSHHHSEAQCCKVNTRNANEHSGLKKSIGAYLNGYNIQEMEVHNVRQYLHLLQKYGSGGWRSLSLLETETQKEGGR
jgi:hypothetical protein